ncbi:hypothetical protein NG895_23865 [Aeoliella sp. ICT_H6.2]|uniref:Carboxypeptidase regulatory-like domain-containing protein n=1 Tax=Aeoliella straminimaris TaxID=2954799 RepID=A0A9X2JIV8_9BACT|nr:hypothetical protein [Aeoliella straminimaris]MCO6046947.1 hypothetical protein [Aeoliella straminimaris]
MTTSGCGDGKPETAVVTGTVSYQGKPLPEGQIAFYPEIGRMAAGPIAADGTYTLTTFEAGDGALVGKHTVTITAKRVTGGMPEAKSFEEEIRMASDPKSGSANDVRVTWLAPAKYAERKTTPLQREVKAGSNVLDFDLTD